MLVPNKCHCPACDRTYAIAEFPTHCPVCGTTWAELTQEVKNLREARDAAMRHASHRSTLRRKAVGRLSDKVRNLRKSLCCVIDGKIQQEHDFNKAQDANHAVIRRLRTERDEARANAKARAKQVENLLDALDKSDGSVKPKVRVTFVGDVFEIEVGPG